MARVRFENEILRHRWREIEPRRNSNFWRKLDIIGNRPQYLIFQHLRIKKTQFPIMSIILMRILIGAFSGAIAGAIAATITTLVLNQYCKWFRKNSLQFVW